MYNNFYHHALHQHQTTGHCSFVYRYLISDHLFRFIDVGVNVANKAGTLWCVEMAECTRVTGQVRLECLSQTPSSHSVCAIRTPLGVDQKIQARTHAGCMTEGKRTVKQLVWRTYCSFLYCIQRPHPWLFHKGCGLSNLEAELLLQSTNNDCCNGNGWLPAHMNFRESPWRETNIR